VKSAPHTSSLLNAYDQQQAATASRPLFQLAASLPPVHLHTNNGTAYSCTFAAYAAKNLETLLLNCEFLENPSCDLGNEYIAKNPKKRAFQ